jgi:hypothetical protein
MAVGTYQGHPHEWLEIWNGKAWEIEDPTLGNCVNPKDYKTSNHVEWEFMLRSEGKIKELEERQP